jgi:hypothetical protein
MAPEKTLVIGVAASAMPSMIPTMSVVAPSVVTRKIGNSAWIKSDNVSMNRLTKPSIHIVRGIRAEDRRSLRRPTPTCPPPL